MILVLCLALISSCLLQWHFVRTSSIVPRSDLQIKLSSNFSSPGIDDITTESNKYFSLIIISVVVAVVLLLAIIVLIYCLFCTATPRPAGGNEGTRPAIKSSTNGGIKLMLANSSIKSISIKKREVSTISYRETNSVSRQPLIRKPTLDDKPKTLEKTLQINKTSRDNFKQKSFEKSKTKTVAPVKAKAPESKQAIKSKSSTKSKGRGHEANVQKDSQLGSQIDSILSLQSGSD